VKGRWSIAKEVGLLVMALNWPKNRQSFGSISPDRIEQWRARPHQGAGSRPMDNARPSAGEARAPSPKSINMQPGQSSRSPGGKASFQVWSI
jgi:hypothetical protein